MQKFRLLCIGNVGRKQTARQDYTPATIAIGHHHTIALNNGGKMKICKKHQIFEVIR